jgi:hypothetical protein
MFLGLTYFDPLEAKQLSPTPFCSPTGKDELGQLPEGVGFTAMIDAIIEHEVAGGVIDGGKAESGE